MSQNTSLQIEEAFRVHRTVDENSSNQNKEFQNTEDEENTLKAQKERGRVVGEGEQCTEDQKSE